MPWHGVSPVDLRVEFCHAYASQQWSMTELCEQYGISRKTGYKWAARYDAHGRAGLADRARRPHTSAWATDEAIVARLCEARRRHPTWSARKLLCVLRNQDPTQRWPARSTGCALLKARGLVRVRRRRERSRAPAPPLATVAGPNDVWTTDFKGEFRTGDGIYCYPLTLRDAFSRYVLRCDALDAKHTAGVRGCFERAFAAYGLPARIRSDNGGRLPRQG